ncbi:ATP-grasp domain-containing protein [Kitasatospora sp. NPDC051170]|uniref:ATP-grasp domain-containing protein n=1 Tax=Kitasatospora sp. NPDC051170 TaxID=3364056 RepID=UPI003791FF5F
MTERRPQAFVLTGAFWVVCRNPRYLEELAARGLKILLITPRAWRERALAAQADPTGPAALIDEIAFVDGELNQDGSFTAGVLARAADWRARYRIVGAYAVGETLVEPTGLLADALGLPGPGLRATRVCRSKPLQRWYLPEFAPAGAVVPAAERAAFDPASVTYPVVLKPAARHSSSGVVTVGDAQTLAALLADYPEHETLLVEQKVVGQEYSVESLVQEGKVIFASVTRKATTESHAATFVELSHSVPSAPEPVDRALLEANATMLAALDFGSGIAHAEWRVDAAGRPVLMEVAARTPGDGLLALYRLATGEPLEPEIVRLALGELAGYPEPRRWTRQVYLEHREGILDGVRVDWPGVRPVWLGESGVWPDPPVGGADGPGELRAVLVLKERGSRLGPLESSEDRAVCFLIDAPSPEELDALEQRVRAAVTIEVRDVD